MKRERCADDAVYVHEYPPELAFILTQRPHQQLRRVEQVEEAAINAEEFEYAGMRAESFGSGDEYAQPEDEVDESALSSMPPAPDTSGDWMLEFYETFDQASEYA